MFPSQGATLPRCPGSGWLGHSRGRRTNITFWVHPDPLAVAGGGRGRLCPLLDSGTPWQQGRPRSGPRVWSPLRFLCLKPELVLVVLPWAVTAVKPSPPPPPPPPPASLSGEQSIWALIEFISLFVFMSPPCSQKLEPKYFHFYPQTRAFRKPRFLPHALCESAGKSTLFGFFSPSIFPFPRGMVAGVDP